MSKKTYSLAYDGYWREENKASLPNKSGVYTVYRATYNASAGTVSLNGILYIGESADVRSRIAGHEKTQTWRGHLKRGEVLCFNFAPISADRVRVEAALIRHHRPPVNVEYVDSFPYDETRVQTSGRNALLNNDFTVYRNNPRSAWR